MFWHTDITDNTEIEPSQMAIVPIYLMSHRNEGNGRKIEPSQMAGGFESPKGEKFLRPDGSWTSQAAEPSGKRPEVGQ
jgi:hypothetical protein